MIEPQAYLRLRYREGGRERPHVDCWGLYRLIVGEASGIWLADYEGVTERLSIARTLKREQGGGDWSPVAFGAELPLDLVLLKGRVGEGRDMVVAPLHVGCVTRPGMMMDIEDNRDVLHRAYRDGPGLTAHDKVRVRFLGVFRSAAVAEWFRRRGVAA